MTDNQKVVVEGIKQAINNGGVKAKVSVDFFDDNGKVIVNAQSEFANDNTCQMRVTEINRSVF